MPTFTPPTVLDTPYVNVETPPLPRRLFRFYGAMPRGRSVVRIAGTYRTIDSPDQLTLATATEVYLGGHEYEVSEATAAALIAAGYTVIGAAAVAVEFRAAAQANTTAHPATIVIPAAVQTGDLMLVSLTTGDLTHDTPAGWTLVATSTGTGPSSSPTRQSVFSRIAQAGDASSTLSLTTVSDGAGWQRLTCLVAYSGPAGIGVNAHAVTTSTVEGTSLVAPSVTTTVGNGRIVEFFGASGDGGPPTLTSPATQRANTANGWMTASCSDQAQVTAGATGTQTATSAQSAAWNARTVAVTGA